MAGRRVPRLLPFTLQFVLRLNIFILTFLSTRCGEWV
jgi:hypothetical protein